MSLTFYYAPMSTASVTEAVLAELGVPCERVRLDIGAGTRRPDFLRLNPNGRVPTIVHDGTPIWESAAITLYLGETFGVAAGLYPAPGPKRGEAMKWVVWANVALAEAGGRLAASLPAGSEGGVQAGSQDVSTPDAGAAERAKEDIAACLRILEGALESSPFLLGTYSLADTHMHAFAGWLGMMGVELGPYPNVAQWMARCGARPALSQAAA